MSALLIFLFVAFLMLCALLVFLDADRFADPEPTVSWPITSNQSDSCDNREFAYLGNLVFSDQDWDFIRREQSPSLNKLFIKERRAVITHWLLASSSRLRTIHANHVQNSRHSANLDVFAEIRLLLLFSYLAFLCRSLLLIARFSHPSATSVLALHFQSKANRLFSSVPRVLVAEAADRRSSSP